MKHQLLGQKMVQMIYPLALLQTVMEDYVLKVNQVTLKDDILLMLQMAMVVHQHQLIYDGNNQVNIILFFFS